MLSRVGAPVTGAAPGMPFGGAAVWPQDFPLGGAAGTNFTIVNPAPNATQGMPVGGYVVLRKNGEVKG